MDDLFRRAKIHVHAALQIGQMFADQQLTREIFRTDLSPIANCEEVLLMTLPCFFGDNHL